MNLPGARHPANVVSASLRILIALVAAAVVVGALVAGGWLALLTFTLQSNLMLAVSFGWTAWALLADRRTPPEWLAGSAVFYIVITGLVYNLVLNPGSFRVGVPVVWGLTSSDIAHAVVPVLAFAVWVVLAEHRRIPWRYVGLWLIYLVTYLVAILLVIVVVPEVAAPYPFLDFAAFGWARVGTTMLELLLAFAALAAVLVAIDRWLPRRTLLSEHDRHDA